MTDQDFQRHDVQMWNDVVDALHAAVDYCQQHDGCNVSETMSAVIFKAEQGDYGPDITPIEVTLTIAVMALNMMRYMLTTTDVAIPDPENDTGRVSSMSIPAELGQDTIRNYEKYLQTVVNMDDDDVWPFMVAAGPKATVDFVHASIHVAGAWEEDGKDFEGFWTAVREDLDDATAG